MRRLFKALKYVSLFLLIAFAIVACDKEYNSIDSEVLGEENTNFNASKTEFKILAYNKKLDSLQINNLGSSLLGFYNDPIYGETTASLITQITPTTTNPDFGTGTVIDSVILNIPYYSRATGEVNDESIPIYTISDSIFGNESAPIKLTIYRNNYFLRDFNPNSETNTAQNYYSNASNADKANNYAITENSIINFDDHKGEVIYESNASGYKPSEKAIVLVTGSGDTEAKTASVPALRINLAEDDDKKAYWMSTIIAKQDQPELSNSNNFINYFRGLYFKTEAINADGQMIMLNTSSTDSKITIYYSKDSTVSGETTQATYVLSFTGNKVNPFINTYSQNLQNGDRTIGDEKLYLKGTEGSMAVVDLFNGLVNCEESNTQDTALECFKKTYRQLNEDNYILKSGESIEEINGVEYITKNGNFVLKRLINEAQLVIYEDEENVSVDDETHEFDRIYAYDITNNQPTLDYLFDATDNTANPEFSKFVSLGVRTKYEDTDGEHYKYKIRITEHLNSILVRDSTNTKLGLVLSNNVNTTSNSNILESNDIVTGVPAASVLSPRGTVLHGNNDNVIDNRKMKLEIYSTEQKE
ncbi:DUF4270 domain-containing protein [Postechiella marina]|uniref:DUF4270 domain-containing protein n=1 Tax=Postechiella marina TaxID=943941 RepID=A0ABP8C854_9FLAO